MELTFEVLKEPNLKDINDFQLLFPNWKRKSILKKLKETENKKDKRIIVRDQEKIIAHLKINFHKDIHKHRVILSSMVVIESYRKKGIGEKLVKFSIKNLPKEIKLILLEVNENNKTALKLYKKLGFKKYGYLKKATIVSNKFSNNILLEKEL